MQGDEHHWRERMMVPFPERPPSSKDFVLRDHQLAEPFQSIDPPDHPFLDHPFSNPEDSLRRIVLRSSHEGPNPKVPIPRTSTPGEKMDKQLSNLNVQIGMLEDLLRDLYPRLDVQSAQHVDRTLGKISSHDRTPPTAPGLPKTRNATEYPLVTVDYTKEDFNSLGEMQALGFVGEHTEMVWLCRLKYALEQSSVTPSTSQENFIRPSVTSMNYYNNDWDMGIRDEVDLLERPSQGMADHLVGTYFQIIHPSFPIIGKMTFEAQYRSYYSDPTARPGKRWLAVLNFMFATAAMHLSRVKKLTECNEYPHLSYFSRAWILSMDKASMWNHPNLQQVQVEGLAAFYLLERGQVNRC
ncbi:hypothetical protein N7522_000472 [Penicillium canescens]|nr:hypothetical protein N7522_000472 [Penicillium canescens]KAJ6174398.1 hypothetical protein N7485_005464 [Penicillium canescens]